MTGLKSTISVTLTAIVVELNVDDLSLEDVVFQLSQRIIQHQSNFVIINLSALEVLTSKDVGILESMSSTFSIMGKQVTVCGINPLCASLIYNFVDELAFNTELNVDYALQAISNK